MTPTDYTFTGQKSYAGSFGLLYYNARWVDPYLGRMAQADTIIPPGVQGLDRYAYTENDPVNYTDPSGHARCSEEGECWEGKHRTKNIQPIDYRKNIDYKKIKDKNNRDESSDPNDIIFHSCQNALIGSTCNWQTYLTPNWEPIPGKHTSADLHRLTGNIHNQNWKYTTTLNVVAMADAVGLIGAEVDFITSLNGWDPFGTETFSEKVDDKLIEYAIQFDQEILIEYDAVKDMTGNYIEGALSVSTKDFGEVQINLIHDDALAATLWFYELLGQ